MMKFAILLFFHRCNDGFSPARPIRGNAKKSALG